MSTIKSIQCGAPIYEIAKLVNITSITRVCDTYSYSVHGIFVNQQT